MKKTIITAMVAVAAFGFSGNSFAGSSSSSSSPGPNHGQMGGTNINDNKLDLNVDVTTKTDITHVDINKSINADFQAPAAGGNIGQVAYDAPAVGGDMINVSARAIAIQNGEVAPVYPDLVFMGSGGAMAGTGFADAAADAAADASSDASTDAVGGLFGGNGASAGAAAADAASSAAAAGGTSGFVVMKDITTGAVSTGAVTIDLSNAATAFAVGGAYNYNAPAVTP